MFWIVLCLPFWRPVKQETTEWGGEKSACARCKQTVDLCVSMQGCVRGREMKREIILLLPRGLSQPRRLHIGPLTHAWAESYGPLIGPCVNNRDKSNICVWTCSSITAVLIAHSFCNNLLVCVSPLKDVWFISCENISNLVAHWSQNRLKDRAYTVAQSYSL